MSVDDGVAPVRVTIVYDPRCPRVDLVRRTVRRALSRTAIRAEVVEVVGPCASPTLLVGGVDVAGGMVGAASSCRLDLPTLRQTLAALERAQRSCRLPHGEDQTTVPRPISAKRLEEIDGRVSFP